MSTNKVWVRVCPLEAVPTGRAINVHINNQRCIIARCGDQAYIAQGYCTHMLYALRDSAVKDCLITCSLHGSQFDLRDGSVQSWVTPLTDEIRQRKALRVYETEVRDGVVYVAWNAESAEKVRVRL
ncbi:MAG: Rieske 2Fe-2S domain-containing protein [Anaerolineae bacterium]|nr:Rieske 2Fe-2S domain-containing protein [Anaerolineae bacterium]MDW8299902.1 Rieske 2Fe-2S domain-containing protein [Anaerolineae bacterium]